MTVGKFWGKAIAPRSFSASQKGHFSTRDFKDDFRADDDFSGYSQVWPKVGDRPGKWPRRTPIAATIVETIIYKSTDVVLIEVFGGFTTLHLALRSAILCHP